MMRPADLAAQGQIVSLRFAIVSHKDFGAGRPLAWNGGKRIEGRALETRPA